MRKRTLACKPQEKKMKSKNCVKAHEQSLRCILNVDIKDKKNRIMIKKFISFSLNCQLNWNKFIQFKANCEKIFCMLYALFSLLLSCTLIFILFKRIYLRHTQKIQKSNWNSSWTIFHQKPTHTQIQPQICPSVRIEIKKSTEMNVKKFPCLSSPDETSLSTNL